MPLTRTNIIRLIRILIILLFVTLITGYAAFRSLDYLRGPEIMITSPTIMMTKPDSTIIVSGQALRISEIKLNGKNISTDENGYWSESLYIFRGPNKITIEARDRFQRQISQTLEIYGIDE